jgi:hypothetical protein
MPEPDRQRLEANRRRWEAMSQDERAIMRDRLIRLREMPPERRRELLDRELGIKAEAGSIDGPALAPREP